MKNIKKTIESLLKPIARKTRINPNILTLAAIISMAIAGYEVTHSNLITGAIFLSISGILDTFDGTIARAQNKGTGKGAFFDRVGDRISDFIIISSLHLGNYIDAPLALATLFFMYTASYESAAIESLTKTRVGESLSLRGLRLALLFIGLIAAQIYYATILVLAVSIYSFFKRLHYAWRHI